MGNHKAKGGLPSCFFRRG